MYEDDTIPALPRVTLAGPGACVTPLGLGLLAEAAEARDMWPLAGRLRWSAESGETLLLRYRTRRLLASALVGYLHGACDATRQAGAGLLGRML